LLGGDFAWKERMFCWVKFGVCRGVCLPCSLILIKGFLALVTEVRRGLNLLSNLRFGWILVNLLLFEYSEWSDYSAAALERDLFYKSITVFDRPIILTLFVSVFCICLSNGRRGLRSTRGAFGPRFSNLNEEICWRFEVAAVSFIGVVKQGCMKELDCFENRVAEISFYRVFYLLEL